MEIRQNAVARWLVLFVTVSGALACETHPPIDDNPVATPAPSSSAGGTPAVGVDTSKPVVADAGAPVVADASNDGGSGAAPDPTVVAEVMRRWNATVDAGNWSIDFHWTQVDQFPHPTFKFGTAETYGQFASVLLTFFQSGDNFNFLTQNHLFIMELRADTLSGQGDVITSFEALADYFSSPSAFGDITPDVRASLAQFAEKIHALA